MMLFLCVPSTQFLSWFLTSNHQTLLAMEREIDSTICFSVEGIFVSLHVAFAYFRKGCLFVVEYFGWIWFKSLIAMESELTPPRRSVGSSIFTSPEESWSLDDSEVVPAIWYLSTCGFPYSSRLKIWSLSFIHLCVKCSTVLPLKKSDGSLSIASQFPCPCLRTPTQRESSSMSDQASGTCSMVAGLRMVLLFLRASFCFCLARSLALFKGKGC